MSCQEIIFRMIFVVSFIQLLMVFSIMMPLGVIEAQSTATVLPSSSSSGDPPTATSESLPKGKITLIHPEPTQNFSNPKDIAAELIHGEPFLSGIYVYIRDFDGRVLPFTEVSIFLLEDLSTQEGGGKTEAPMSTIGEGIVSTTAMAASTTTPAITSSSINSTNTSSSTTTAATATTSTPTSTEPSTSSPLTTLIEPTPVMMTSLPPSTLPPLSSERTAFHTGRSNSKGYANMTNFTIETCGKEGQTFRVVVCPGGSSSHALRDLASEESKKQCSAPFRILLRSNYRNVGLRYVDQSSCSLQGLSNCIPSAFVGDMVPFFRIDLITSCNAPMGNTSDALRLKKDGNIYLQANGIMGMSRQPLQLASARLFAFFSNLRFTYLPRGQNHTLTTMKFTLVATGVSGHAEVTASISAKSRPTLSEPPPRPPVSAVSISLLRINAKGTVLTMEEALQQMQQVLQEDLLQFSQGGRSSVTHTLPNTGTSGQFLATNKFGQVLVSTIQQTSVQELRDNFVMLALRFNISVFNDPSAENRYLMAQRDNLRRFGPEQEVFLEFLNSHPTTLLVGKESIFVTSKFDKKASPRGFQYGMLRTGDPLVRAFPLFQSSHVRTDGVVFVQHYFPIILRPLPTLTSRVNDVVSIDLVPNFFITQAYRTVLEGGAASSGTSGSSASGTNADQSSGNNDLSAVRRAQLQTEAAHFQLNVEALPANMLSTVRSFFSIGFILNTDIGYTSMVIFVADCSMDKGQPLDVSIHPLRFEMGTNDLAVHYTGTLVGNAIILLGIFVSTGLVAKKIQSRHKSSLIFPHVFLYAATALYPGTMYSCFALLPFIKHGYWYPLWCSAGIVYALLYPLVLVRLAISMCPQFCPTSLSGAPIAVKLFSALGHYRILHFDHIRFRHSHNWFRGPQRAFFAPIFLLWLITAGIGYFEDCQPRFIVVLILNCIYFCLLVSRAPFLTTYWNTLHIFSTILRIVALCHLAWDNQEQKFAAILSVWLVILSGLSVMAFIFELLGQYVFKWDFMKNDEAGKNIASLTGFLVVPDVKDSEMFETNIMSNAGQVLEESDDEDDDPVQRLRNKGRAERLQKEQEDDSLKQRKKDLLLHKTFTEEEEKRRSKKNRLKGSKGGNDEDEGWKSLEEKEHFYEHADSRKIRMDHKPEFVDTVRTTNLDQPQHPQKGSPPKRKKAKRDEFSEWTDQFAHPSPGGKNNNNVKKGGLTALEEAELSVKFLAEANRELRLQKDRAQRPADRNKYMPPRGHLRLTQDGYWIEEGAPGTYGEEKFSQNKKQEATIAPISSTLDPKASFQFIQQKIIPIFAEENNDDHSMVVKATQQQPPLGENQNRKRRVGRSNSPMRRNGHYVEDEDDDDHLDAEGKRLAAEWRRHEALKSLQAQQEAYDRQQRRILEERKKYRYRMHVPQYVRKLDGFGNEVVEKEEGINAADISPEQKILRSKEMQMWAQEQKKQVSGQGVVVTARELDSDVKNAKEEYVYVPKRKTVIQSKLAPEFQALKEQKK